MPQHKRKLRKHNVSAEQAEPAAVHADSDADDRPKKHNSSGAASNTDDDISPDDLEFTSEDTTAADIQSIYNIDGDEDAIDMTTLDQNSGRKKWVLVLVAAVVLLAVGATYAGYRLFRPQPGAADTELTVTMEKNIASGDVLTVVITYENKKTVDIVSGDIELVYPDGFFVEKVEPEASDDAQRKWTLQRIRPGAGGTIRITGQLVGEQDEEKKFSTLWTYQPENFLHDFQARAEASTTISSSKVKVETTLPSQAASGDEVVYSVEYTNTSSAALKNVKLVVEYPNTFTYTSASEEPSTGTNEWRIDELKPNETKTLEMKGKIEGKSGATKQFTFQLGLVELDNSFNVQVSKTALLVIVNPEVEVSITAPELVSIGDDPIPFTVHIENTSEAALRDVKVELSFNGAAFAQDKPRSQTTASLAPGEKKELPFEIELKKEMTGANQELEIVVTVPEAIVEGKTVSFPNQASAKLKVKGNLHATAQGRYYDDNLKKIGNGPLPPEANSETTYIIWWNMQAEYTDMNNVRFSTMLPETVIWKDEATEGVEYDPDTRRVNFTTERLGANSEVQVSFAVSISPTAEDIGSLMVLTEKTEISAQDAFTKEQITRTENRISTDLSSDEGADDKGEVQKSS